MEAQCLDAFALPMSPRHASPSHARRAERCYFLSQHTADLAGLLLLFVCVPPPACLPARSTRALITNAQRLHCQPALETPVIPLGLQQSSLILPVFTNRPFSCSSNPDTRVFVRRSPRNPSLPAKHCCAGLATRRADTRPTRSISRTQPADCPPAIENRRQSASP